MERPISTGDDVLVAFHVDDGRELGNSIEGLVDVA